MSLNWALQIMNTSSHQDCLNAALRLLAGRDHSSVELGRKLKQRHFQRDQIQSALGECRRLNYLNDERFAHEYAQQLQRKGYGALRIRQMLASKGVETQLISEVLVQKCHETAERDVCRKALAKKIKTTRLEALPRDRIYRFLSSRGFTPAVIHLTLNDAFSSQK